METNLPYYANKALLHKLQKRSKRDRIKFHIQRVRRDKVVYRVLDTVTMSNVVDNSELHRRLESIQRDIKQTEAHLKLHEDRRFQSLRSVLFNLMTKYAKSAERSHNLLVKYLGNSKDATLKTLLLRLRTEESWIDMALGVELQIQDMCRKLKVDSSHYVSVARTLDANRGEQLRKVLLDNFGYSR